MKLLQVADLHLGLARYGTTGADNDRLHAKLVELVQAEQPSVVVFAGDVSHTKRPSPAEILRFVRLVRAVTTVADVLVIPGNHDGPGEVEDPENKTAGWLAEVRMPRVISVPVPRTVEIGGARFVCLPYVHPRANAAPHLADMIRAGAEHRPDGIPHIFVGHQSVAGSKLGVETMMQMGWDLTVEPGVFEGYDYAALGHIHYQQQVAPVAWYSGSIERLDFGEAHQPKGVLVVDVQAGVLPVVTPHDLGARQMLAVEIEDVDDLGFLDQVQAGSVVSVVVKHPVSSAIQRELEREIRAAGARTARVQAVNIVRRRLRDEADALTRSRIATSSSPLDALRAWCQVTGEDFDALRPAAEELTASLTPAPSE